MDKIKTIETKLEDCFKRYLQALLKINTFKQFKKNFETSKILDYAAGVGSLVSMMRHELPDATVHGYEPSTISVKQGIELYSNLDSDCFSVRVPDTDYDVIVSQYLYKYLDSKQAFFEHCYELLVKDGVLILEITSNSLFDRLFRRTLSHRFNGWEVKDAEFEDYFKLVQTLKSPVANYEFETLSIQGFRDFLKSLAITILRGIGDVDSMILVFEKKGKSI